MTFLYRHTFTCQVCAGRVIRETRGHAMVEQPLLKNGVRTLHCEEDSATPLCLGKMTWVGTVTVPPKESELVRLALRHMVTTVGVPLKPECVAAINAMWNAGLADGTFSQEMELPDNLWKTVQGARERDNDYRESLRPKNAVQALNKAIADGAGRDQRTLAVAYNPSTKESVTGYSAGEGTAGFRRHQGAVVRADGLFAPLVSTLNSVERKAGLGGREVWVCAEIDAATKALRKGWSLSELKFAAAEYKGEGWRHIEACPHCSQWCSS